jgi:hypothetical protein
VSESTALVLFTEATIHPLMVAVGKGSGLAFGKNIVAFYKQLKTVIIILQSHFFHLRSIQHQNS